jgi:uncharacterized protein YlzI (FlbEa/FlbD family)
MSGNFQSIKKFSDLQIELMVSEIAEILEKLRKNSVYDFDKEKSILLLDREATRIELKKTELMEVKRFVALVKLHMPALTYLTKKMQFVNVTEENEREDRIMGAINYSKTIRLRQRNAFAKDKAVCLEIHRGFTTPENKLLALVISSIAAYCNKYILRDGNLESGSKIDKPTLLTLKRIRLYVDSLLVTKDIKKILPYVIGSTQDNEYHHLFGDMICRVRLGKIPSYFANVFNLFYEWRYFRWVVSISDTKSMEHMLRYYFYNVKKPSMLYECWVFYKILDIMIDYFKVKFKETRSSETTFMSEDGSIKMIYQKRYKTIWFDEDGNPIEEIPDIVIQSRNGSSIVVDAKNAEYSSKSHNPYRRQIVSYIDHANAKYGILIFSDGDTKLWKDLKTQDGRLRAIWTVLSPSQTGDKNATVNSNLVKFMHLVHSVLT